MYWNMVTMATGHPLPMVPALPWPKSMLRAPRSRAQNWTFETRVGGTPGQPNGTDSLARHGALQLSEVAAAGDAGFFVEIHNPSDQPVPLGGLVLAGSGSPENRYVFPAQTLAAGGYVAVQAAQLGFLPLEGDRLFVLSADRSQVLDGVRVADRLQARADALDGRWQSPLAATPGSVNTFDFHDQIVINEIMYKARPTYATAATFGADALLPIDAVWRYEQSGTDLGTAWIEPGYDDSQWPSGQGLFYLENSDLPGPKNTPLELGKVTYYFRTTFQWDGPSDGVRLDLRHVVDDGAVFYLNGVELDRFNMPSGSIGAETTASSAVSNAGYIGPIVIPNDRLQPGTNTLAVEVHQNLAFSPDVVFGADLSIQRQLTPETPFAPSDEEWIELYNRSDQTIDLSGWAFQDAIRFDFPMGTLLAPNQYLVVASDAADLAARHPGINVIGEFSGQLSDSDERIQLLDARRNLADEVHYFDGGRWPESPDGGGASLELRDPHADNSHGEVWSASDETMRSTWNHFSYTRTIAPIVHDPPINFHEFVMGLLGPGEVWLDNIRVIESPGQAEVPLIQNGDFEADTPNGPADKWRLVGTHRASEVINDPDQPGNQVLRLVAESRMNYLSNHAETTLANRARVIDGRTYEISFDAKWISGTPQLHTELYYKDAARTTILPQPSISGTPGRKTRLGKRMSGRPSTV